MEQQNATARNILKNSKRQGTANAAIVFCEQVHLAFCLLLHLLHSISMSGTDKPGAYLDTSLCACQTTSLLGKLFAEIMHSQD